MALSTLSNGESGLDARTKINAAIAALNVGVPKTYFVSASLGDDGTAEVGNPALPYQTAQAAFDDWLVTAAEGHIHIMDGDAGGLVLVGNMGHTLHITGNGAAFCYVGGIAASGVYGSGGDPDQGGSNGDDGFTMLFTSDYSVNFGAIHGNGGDGGSGGAPVNQNTNGGSGGACSLTRMLNVLCEALSIYGGNGGAGQSFDGGDSGGDGGGLSEVILSGVIAKSAGDTSITLWPGGAGGGSLVGSEGSGGTALIMFCRLTNALTAYATAGVVANNTASSFTIAGGVTESGNAPTAQSISWP